MSGCGFRGRGFGPRGARANGPTTGFGPRFSHPKFNFPRPPPNRLPGPDNWIERPNFPPWQPNANFPQRPQFRGNLQFRPNGRGRAPNARGMVRFSGPGRPPGPQFHFVRNIRPRAPAPQEEQVHENPNPVPEPQAPLLGSEEERQQKITETADKLKQTLFSITEEDSSTFWEDDLSVIPNSTTEEEIIRRKGIPELKHDPPELDLTFTDFKDIGRVDSNNPKFENVENIDDISNVMFTYTSEVTDKLESTNDEITIISEHNRDVEIIESINNESFVTPGNDEFQEQKSYDLTNAECDLEILNFQSDHIEKSLVSTYSTDTNEISLVTDSNRTTIDLPSIPSANDFSNEASKEAIDAQNAPKGPNILQNQDALQETISHNEYPADTKVQTNDNVLGNLQQAEDNSQTSPMQEINQISMTLPASSQSCSSNFPPVHEEIQPNTVSDLPLPIYSQYNEVHKSGEDKKLKNAFEFQPRIFNAPPRFNPRISGPRCRWTFQQGGKNLFFRGPQRLPIHGNRMPPPRHMVRFPQTDLVPITFDPRAPPPFTPNVPASNHDSQHQTLLPFSPNDLPPSFDPTEPPPNVRSATVPEGQDMLQNVPPFDMRNQSGNVSSNNVEMLQPPVVFDPREPPPRITNIVTTTSETLPNFNPQQPPPKVRNQEETFQPPPIFDPRLSSQERSKLIAPLDTSGSNVVTMNLMETSQVPDYSMPSVAGSFSQLPINIPLPQSYMSNMQLNYQRVLPHTNSGQMVHDYPLPPPPLPKNSMNRKEAINQQHTLNMDDGLEDMQEAMEFAKQVMNMSGEMKKDDHVATSQCPDVPLPSEIPVPNENINISCSVPLDQLNSNVTEKSKVKGNACKSAKDDNHAVKPTSEKKSKKEKVTVEERSIPDLCKNAEDVPLTSEQIRPKVVFNLNCKLKKINKPEEWQYESQVARQRKKSDGKKNNLSKSTNQQKERISEKPSVSYGETAKTSEKLNDTFHHKPHNEKSHAQSSNVTASNNVNEQNLQKSKRQTKKTDAPTSESSWKNRVISRFLKMSKNDICNMVNNSSLRKFDIAMKHLVKERRSSLSLEMRNIEDEKMKEYDREEFMNQLNAMLDPSAVVGITDLPTEFIHHLSEVLQLDPMPFESSFSSKDDANLTEPTNIKQKSISRTSNPECTVKELEDTMVNVTMEHEDVNIEHRKRSKSQDTIREKSSEVTLSSQNNEYSDNAYHHLDSVHLTLDPIQENSSSRKDNMTEKVHSEIETSHKKQFLFNEADLDNILSEVTERSNSIAKPASSQEPRKSTSETHKTSTSTKARGGSYNSRNESPQFRSRTVADLDDIFSATIARVKPNNKIISLEHSRPRKSTSEDRSTFRVEKYSRWSRKERENPDAFRNLTKEEWEAKYGRSMNTTPSSSCTRRSGSNSSDNLFREREHRNYRSQRYCSSDSPMRHLSISPLVRESTSLSNAEKYSSEYNGFEESNKSEQMDSCSSDSDTSSTSDGSEETVSPNVTKLLKVIKEKEKIAKKKSLNETIRDEVAAEIEKKWKEKSKHKERKSRKREKRKRDKREKRKKERKKRRKRSSPCDVSKYGDDFEENRLLTEEEIKKEVIVKEEPDELLDTNDTSISGSSTASFMLCNRAIELPLISHIESQDSQMPKQFVSAASTMQLSVNSKPAIAVATTQQPKTKAQLKQMPESSDLGKKKQLENFVEIAVSNINVANTNNEQNKVKIRSTEIINNTKNVQQDKVLPMSNNSSSQIDLTSNTVEIANTEVKGDNEKSIKVIPSLLNTSSSIVDVNATNEQNNSRLAVTSTSGSIESKCGFKKIDIKAYKERALQRRLKEQSKSNEMITDSFQSLLDLQSTSASDKPQSEFSSMENRMKVTVPDTDRGQTKCLESTEETESAVLHQENSYKALEQKSNVESPYVSTEALQNISTRLTDNNGSSVFKSIERSLNQIADSDSTKNQIQCKDSKTSSKPTSTSTVASKQILHKSHIQVKSKLPSEEKNSKKPNIVDFNKFKNIRSEGSKELKLKKEKIKKLSEKKKTLIKAEKGKSSSLPEKHAEKHSAIAEQKPEDGMQKAKVTDGKNTSKLDTNTRTDYCDNSELTQNKKTAHTNRVPMIPLFSNVESMSNDENSMKPMAEHELNREDNNERSHVTTRQGIHDNKNKYDKVTDEKNATDSVIHPETLESQEMSKEENVDVQGDQATKEENEQRDIKEADTITTKSNEADNTLRETVLTEDVETKATNSEESFNNDPRKFSATEFGVTEDLQNSIDTNEESLSVRDCTEINTMANSNIINNIETSKDIGIDNSIPCTEMDISVTKNMSNSITNTVENILEQDKDNDEFYSNTGISESTLSEPRKMTECQELQTNDLKSPESSGSPFKGFLVDSIEDDIREASELLNLQINKDVEVKIPEDQEKWLETCLDENFDWKGIKENEKSICTNDEVSESINRENQNNNADLLQTETRDKNEVPNCMNPVNDNVRSMVESEMGKIFVQAGKSSPTMNMHIEETFDENSEPFIILDEYIDDTDGKSIGKLSSTDLDLEDCVATDTTVFLKNNFQEKEVDTVFDIKSPDFNSRLFKVLSEVPDRDVDTEVDEEGKGKSDLHLKPLKDTVESTISLECNKSPDLREEPVPSVGTVFEDVSQQSTIIESLPTEISKVDQKSLQADDESESSFKDTTVSYQVTSPVVETSKKLNVPTKAALKKSVEDFLTRDESLGYKSPQQVSSLSEKVDDEVTHTGKNDIELNNNAENELVLHSAININVELDPVELGKSRDLDDTSRRKHRDEERLDSKSHRKDDNDSLHKLRNKQKMKHKQDKKRKISEKKIKSAVQSDTVQVVHPNTKESIMARMIEIDVEIHKLMTEKMTLYEMLKSTNLPDNNVQNDNVVKESKEAEVPIVRPHTPSALVSQLIQNIESSPVVSQSTKGVENTSSKDNTTDSQQSGKHKSSSKHEHSGSKRSSSSCNSVEEEVTHSSGSTKSSAFRKKKRQKCEKSGRPEDVSEIIATAQETVEKKQADATKSVQKKIGNTVRQEVIERKVEHASSKSKNQGTVNDVEKKNSQNNEKNSSTRQSSNKTGKKSSETSAIQDPVHESDKSKLSDVRNESTLPNDNENEMRIQNDEETASSTSKVPDNRTPEILSMYSDDSTWESFLQNPGLDAIDQKKPSTGLALLEETYRKEIAKSRKMKAEARKKKKQQLQSLLRSVNTLTMEEEELPLCTLYIKKLQQKKSLLDTLDQKADELTPNEDSQVWRNVVEVINAVAEDRIEDLYMEQLEKQSDDNSQNITTEIPGESGSALNEERSDSNISLNVDTVLPQGEEIKKIASCSSKSSDKIKPIVESNDKFSCEIKHDAVNDSKRHESTTVSNKVRTESAASSTAKSNESNQEDSMDDVNSSNTKVLVCDLNNEQTTAEDGLSKTAETNEPVINLSISTDNDINSQQVSRNPETVSSLSKKVREEITDGNIQNEPTSVLMTEQPEKDCSNSDVCSNYEKNAVKLNVVTEKHSSEESNTHKEKLIVHAELQCEKVTGNIKLEEDNNVPNNDYFINTKDARGCQKKRKESERSNDTLSEDNFNESSSVIDITDTSRNEDSVSKKSSKRKRQNSNTPLRRSSRYTEEISKRIKIEPDSNTHCNEQDFQDRNLHMYYPSSKSPTPLSSYDEEAENTPTNVKRNKGMQKLQNNRKRTMRSESEMSTNTLSSNDEFVVLKEDIRQTKERKQYTMSEMMNCKVRLVDSKYTILKPNVHPSVLKKYGITSINLPSICAPADPMIQTLEEIPIIKDTASFDTKHTSKMDSTQQQTVKPAKKCDDTSRSSDEQGNPVKVKKIQKSQRMNVSISDKEEYVESSIDDIPVLMNEQAMVDVARNFWEPDIEIVEEKSIGKTQHQNNLESTLSVIEITDDKEIPRTQYTVHKGPILDIKVFESSFLAASEDGRIYRYSQTSNGILNIYKGHKSAVTCLYVYDSGVAELSKEWMFSGSLDGTLRCYNITSGVQMRDTADIGSPIQCMDQAWGMIFIGTKSGHVSRYHIKSGAIKGSSIQFSDQSVLALKATNEGARRVLIVASRSQPITIRDAQSGLFLRTICGERNHTVYSLMRHNNLIYCGTSSTSILVFDFTNAEQTMQYDAGVGIVCMRLYKRLLFAGCYDGNIYVFDTKDHRLVCSIPGPGNMLLSMEIIDNKIIAGSKDRRLHSWQMPQQVRSLLQKIMQKVSTDTS